jgi:transcriptional regulator with GAF, ATPase, and Fis domain
MILNPSGPLAFEHLNLSQQQKSSNLPEETIEPDNLDDAITKHIRRVLGKTKGKIHGSDGAAILLGINPSTLRNRMNKLGIKYGRKA